MPGCCLQREQGLQGQALRGRSHLRVALLQGLPASKDTACINTWHRSQGLSLDQMACSKATVPAETE